MDFGKYINILNSISLSQLLDSVKPQSKEQHEKDESLLRRRSITEQVEVFRQDLIRKRHEKSS